MTVAQGIQHAMSMPHIILSSVACLPAYTRLFYVISHPAHSTSPSTPLRPQKATVRKCVF